MVRGGNNQSGYQTRSWYFHGAIVQPLLVVAHGDFALDLLLLRRYGAEDGLAALVAPEGLVGVHDGVSLELAGLPAAALLAHTQLATITAAPQEQQAVLGDGGGVVVAGLQGHDVGDAQERGELQALLAVAVSQLAPGVEAWRQEMMEGHCQQD